ncbi:hypothetical protein K493DRAFT_39426 [Basidiobolus meristosporus CBS 931.73]|uniref:BEN domain-containing protein n=1 Tax=Basidiobolus meristosporus CBS 931.73 TaxID=1314790 RepID=A0A1Y1Y4M2_9FUNG|nr:hypothetical protein K493DRAFT_39426 [Basidiobolus meristosporus CBS 931.73]|eukprot:ORX92971.1 hypothetical protein K493DRAFT_39426 [Basidiobolus meristosporus CBS 931.73]
MEYSGQPTGNNVHGSITSTNHYFDVRFEDDPSTQLRQQLDELQATVLSQITLEFRTLHERLDTVENKFNEVLSSPLIGTRISGLTPQYGVTPSTNVPPRPVHQGISNSIKQYSVVPQVSTPTVSSPLVASSIQIVRPPVASGAEAHTALTPVSQLPSEESAKVKVLLRQFAAQAMGYIEKNASSYTNVNNNTGAITTMKKFDMYDSASWDQFVETHFPHVQKSDLKEELVKIVSVKVKNTKARFKKKLSESPQTHRSLQQPQHHVDHAQRVNRQQQSPPLSDAMSDGISTPPVKRFNSGTLLKIEKSALAHSQVTHQVPEAVITSSVHHNSNFSLL